MLLGRSLLLAAVLMAMLGRVCAAEPTVAFNGWTNIPGTVEGTVNVHPINSTTPQPSLGYVDYLPKGYNPNDHTTRWPVVFALLGVGEEGDGTNAGQLLATQTRHGPLYDVVSLNYDFPCIIICPQAPNPAGWNNVTQLRAMIDYVKANYRADATRLFMTGLCDGCSGTLRFATTYPGILAGIIPITATYSPQSVANNPSQTEANAIKHLPMWMVHCFSDPEFNRRNTVAWCDQVTLADTGMTSNVLATYPGYGGTNNHYACLMNPDGTPNNAFGLNNTVVNVTATNGSHTVTMPSNNMVLGGGSFWSLLWGNGTDAAPFAKVTFGSDSSSYVINGISGDKLSMQLTGNYTGTTQTANASVWTPVGLTETAYYNPLTGAWTWPAATTSPTAAPPEQDPPASGAYDNRIFTMFWQQDHSAGWVNTWKNGKVWDWLFTRAPVTTPATVVLSGLSGTYTASTHSASVTTTPAGLPVDVTYNGSSALPVAAGPYTVVATVNDPTYSGSATGTMTIAPAPVTITLSNLSATWDGSAKPAGVSTSPPGVAVTVSYAGGVVPVEPGSYTVSAVSGDPNFTGSASATLVIGKAIGSVALGQLSFTFDGNPKPITPTTTPASLALTSTYAGSPTAPSAHGDYAVVSTIADAHYQGSASGTMHIVTAAATVTLSGLTATYDGSAHAATVTTSPAGLTTSITYDGAATAPTAAGAHAVVATITDPNFSGSSSGTLTIAQASATVTFTPASLSANFDGTGHAVAVTTAPAGLPTTITYDGRSTLPTSVGSHAVVATVSDPNFTGSASAQLTIGPGTATVTLSGLAVTYTGGQQAALVTTSPSGLATTVTYNGTAALPITAGSYTVAVSVNGPNYIGSANGTLTIAPAPASVALSGLAATYDGNGHAVVVTTTPGNVATTVTYNGDSQVPTDAGSYAVLVQFADPNFQGSSASGTLTIAQATATVSFTDLTSTFDGQPHAVTVVTVPDGLATNLTYDGAATVPSAVGTHAVVATVTDPNYVGSGSATQTIATTPVIITLSGLAATYDGSPKTVSATTSPAGKTVTITYNGSSTAPTEAGSYAIAAAVVDANFQGTAAGTLVIAKATATVTLGALAAVYDGTPKAATATVAPLGLTVTITYNGAAQVPTTAGSYAVVAVVSTADFAGSASGTLIIGKASLTVQADDVTGTVGAVPGLTFHLVGLMPNDGVGVLLGVPALSTTATVVSPAGTYPVTVSLSGVHADNYALVAQTGSVVLADTSGSTTSSGGGGSAGGGSGGGGGCGHGTAFAALLMFALMLMGYARLMVVRPTAPRD